MLRRFPVIVVCLLLATVPLAAEYHQLLDDGTRDLLHEVLSGEIAKDHVARIALHHRIQGSRGYRDAAQYVLKQLHGYGFTEQEAFIESYESDGKVIYQTYQSPSGWDIDKAELRMIEPYEERIAGYPEIAMSLITYSNPGDETAELVWVGSGTRDEDYEGKDVSGKFVLATGYGGTVHRNAVLKHGAVGVICYMDDDRAKLRPDMHQYTGMWPKTEELDKVTFGFNLTKRQGEKLRDMLVSGKKVVLHGKVEGIGLEPYFMDIVVADIKGSTKSDELLILSAHLDHPKESANDNASGSGALIDIARTLNELIASGRMKRPERTIRFLWVPEFYGSIAYIDGHPEVAGPEYGGKTLANINMDMVGENLELIHTYMNITRTPASIPSVVNDVVANMVHMVDRMNIRTSRGSLSQFNFRVTEYQGGSDHAVFVDRKIPGMMIVHLPDYTHHTSEDTLDKVDPVELERSETIAAASMLYLANMTEQQAIEVAYIAAANGAQRMGQANFRAQRLIAEANAANAARQWAEAQNILAHAGQWEKETLHHLLHFNGGQKVHAVVDLLSAQIDGQTAYMSKGIAARVSSLGFNIDKPADLNANPDGRVPTRTTRGPIDGGYLMARLSPEEVAWMEGEGRAIRRNLSFELVNFINGKRTVTEIRNALSAEFTPVETRIVAHYIENLAQAGLVEWN
jgi:hypothetical protein